MALLTQNQFDVLREMHLSEDKCEGDYPWFRPILGWIALQEQCK